MTYTTTAALFGMGQGITDTVSLKGEILGIFCEKRIELLRGSSSLDWDLGNHTREVGAVVSTVQDNAGNAIFFDDKGITCLQSTLSFGDFESSLLSANVKRILLEKRLLIVASRMAKNNYQYRMYFDDGVNLRCTITTGNPVITPEDVSFSVSEYDINPFVVWSGPLSDGLQHMFIGTDDGRVIEEDAGTSYDGSDITYTLRLPYNHMKSANVNKRLHRLMLEIACALNADVSYHYIFNYEDGTYSVGETMVASATGTSEQSISVVPCEVDGECVNAALVFSFTSDFLSPVTIQGFIQYFALLGLTR
jgi:hypothetical protein